MCSKCGGTLGAVTTRDPQSKCEVRMEPVGAKKLLENADAKKKQRDEPGIEFQRDYFR